MASFCEHGNEASWSIESVEFLNQISTNFARKLLLNHGFNEVIKCSFS